MSNSVITWSHLSFKLTSNIFDTGDEYVSMIN